MTVASATARKFVPGTSRWPRPADTVRFEWLMEEAQKLEIAQRITLLRERSPLTQPEVADRLDIGLRAYQKVERVGTTKYERCEELAAIHAEWTADSPEWAYVSADWLWDGRRRDITPDLLKAVEDPSDQLDRIEEKLDQLLAAIARPAARKHPPPPGELGRDAKDSTPTTAHPPQPQKKRAPGKRSDSA